MTNSRHMRRTEFMGVLFDQLTPDELLDEVAVRSRSNQFSYLITPNVSHLISLASAADGPDLDQIFASADLLVCDSRVLRLLASKLNIDLQVATGSDLVAKMLETEWDDAPRIAIIGGNKGTLGALRERYRQFAWSQYRPAMGVRHDRAAQDGIVRFVEGEQADIVLFVIGAPQSEIVCGKIAASGKARGIAMCVGASLEFLLGEKRRAPVWIQKLALEWLFRLVSEPKRLWRRYLVEGPRIFLLWRRWKSVNGDRAGSVSNGPGERKASLSILEFSKRRRTVPSRGLRVAVACDSAGASSKRE